MYFHVVYGGGRRRYGGAGRNSRVSVIKEKKKEGFLSAHFIKITSL